MTNRLDNPDNMRKYKRLWIKKRRDAWFFANGPCVRCGSWKNLQLDHIDPSTKVAHKVWSWSIKRRDTELKKCQVLCEDCHKKKSMEDYRKAVTHCPQGHEYTPENTRYKKNAKGERTNRNCKECHREYNRNRRARMRL